MNRMVKGGLDAAWYVVVFLVLQLVVVGVVGVGAKFVQGAGVSEAFAGMGNLDGKTMAVGLAVTGLLTTLLFVRMKWTPVSRAYLLSRPWAVLVWVAVLALGTLIPSEWLQEVFELDMPDSTARMFEKILADPIGYPALAVLIPLAEETVFRGAILRTLLGLFDKRMHWVPIVLSALVFGLMHGNSVQLVHATLMGLLLGWLYYRTCSIIPGLIFHWVNNTVAYLMCHLMPAVSNARLVDLFQGNEKHVWMAIGFSLCIMLPALFQLAIRLRPAR